MRKILRTMVITTLVLPLTSELLRAAEPVEVSVETVTRPMEVADCRNEGPRAMYPMPGEDRKFETRTIEWSGPIITLNNALLEVKVAPTLGMRVVNAVDLRTGRSLAATDDPREWEKTTWIDYIAWTAGYVEASFPYFEHGFGTRQPAGYRVVRHDDGSVTVAMNMRFTEHQHPRHQSRYGRYSQRVLSVWVTLRPGESRYSAAYCLDNPNPLRRSNRLWTNVLMTTDRYDGEHIIYPVGYIVPHGASWVRPFHAGGGERAWRNVSHFGLYPEYRFAGVYRPGMNTNCLIIRGPGATGMKLYTTPSEGGFLEHWFGREVVFEDPGKFVHPYEPVEYTLWFFNASDIGRAQWADEDLAIGYRDGKFRLVATRPLAAKVSVKSSIGVPVSELSGRMRPGKVYELTGEQDGRVELSIDGEDLGEVLPLTFADTTDRFEQVSKLGGKFRLEMEEICNHIGAPTSRDAIGAARRMLENGVEDSERATSLANTCYRWGHLSLAEKLAREAGDSPQADHLLALIAWERGQEVDFGSAGEDSFHHRALLAVRNDDTEKAIEWLDKLIEARPGVYRPRLLRAWLNKDVSAAKDLAETNPASPEAQLVLELLGVEGAADTRKELVENNPGAERMVEDFRRELTEGLWRHVRRYDPMLPEDND